MRGTMIKRWALVLVVSSWLVACGGSQPGQVFSRVTQQIVTPADMTVVVEGEPERVMVPETVEEAAEETRGEAAAEEPAPSPPRDTSSEESEAYAEDSVAEPEVGAGAAPEPAPPSADRSAQYAPVTAGVVDDNEQWSTYLDYRARHQSLRVNHRDVSERYLIRVIDGQEQPVHDARVEIIADGAVAFEGRTDAGGQLLFHPRALTRPVEAEAVSLVVSKGAAVQEARFTRDEFSPQWIVQLPDAPQGQGIQLDLLFLIDATGSMDDEISKLKATMGDIADEIARLPQRPNVRYALVSYRDRDDAYVTRLSNFTTSLDEFQRELDALQAAGGGDTPEALNQALHESITQLGWRAEGTVRVALLVADAPPHLDYNEPFSYESDMFEAVRRGIKLFPIGASGLDDQGEYIFRQLAQVTGGKFVFLTYAQGGNATSGPGGETDHEVSNYSVDTLDRLVVRLISEELDKLPD